MSIAVVDPGGTTGLCWTAHTEFKKVRRSLMRDDDPSGGVQEMSAISGTLLHSRDIMRWLHGINENYPVRHVLIEDFILQMFDQRREFLYPVIIKAHLEALIMKELPHANVVPRNPNFMSTITDERLKRWGLWVVGKPHGRDAVRHLCAYLRR